MKKKTNLWLIALAVLLIAVVPQAAFAGTEDSGASNAVEGTIALVNWDEDWTASYDTSGKATLLVQPGNNLKWFILGTGTSDDFQPISGRPDSCTISVNKDGWENAIVAENTSVESPIYEKAVFSYYEYTEEDGAGVYIGYNQDAVLMGEDAYGDYDITVAWEIEGNTYTATTSVILGETNNLVRGFFVESDQYEKNKGFIHTWYTWLEAEKNDEGQFQLSYEPYYAYTEKYTMIYNDGEHGILNFVDSDCDIAGVFAVGDSVKYKEDLQIVPLQIDYSKITENMVGKTYTLNFHDTDNNDITCEVVIAYKNELSYLKDGQVYAIDGGKVKDDGKLYIANQDELLQSLVKEKIEADIMQEMEVTRYHFGLWNAMAGNFIPVEISTENSALQIEGSSTEGYIFYAEDETNGFFSTADGKQIYYEFTLPDAGFYREPVRSAENYLGYKVYLAEEDVSSDGYDFYYMVQANATFEKTDLKVEYKDLDGVTVEETDDWTDSASGKDYYVWRIHLNSRVINDPAFDEEIWLDVSAEKNGQDFGAYDWIDIYGTNAVSESQRLYWFYENDVTVDGDGKVSLREGVVNTLNECAEYDVYYGNKELTLDGYFALKKDTEYCAVMNVETPQTTGLHLTSSSDNPYLYTVEWTEFGEYQIIATVDGQTYRYNLTVELPEFGFYSSSTRSEETYLDGEFHYVRAKEKNDAGTEAYFYLIAPAYDFAAQQIKLTFVDWNQKGQEWQDRAAAGISIGEPTIKELSGEMYAVWKIAVENVYRNPNDEEKRLRAVYGEDERWSSWLCIYDSAEIPEDEQLYCFTAYDTGVDENGKIQLLGECEYTIDDIAKRRIIETTKNGTGSMRFGVKINGVYYAVNKLNVSVADGLSLAGPKEDSYEYLIEWTDFGECLITAQYGEKEYYLRFIAQLPEIAFFGTSDRSEDSYLDENEFHYVNAVERNTEGAEAYFYLIAPSYDYSADKIKVDIGERSWDEDGTYEWIEKNIDGITIGAVEIKELNGESYAVCKITVADSYNGNEYLTLRISRGDYLLDSADIHIFDSSEISEEQQLYGFWGYRFKIDSSGKLVPKENENMYEWARENLGSEFNGYYFAVKQGEDYYPVETVSAPKEITIRANDGGTYSGKITKIGKYEIKATYQGKTYRMKAEYSLPDSGYFARAEKTEENYLYGQIKIREAAEKNKSGTESYFYLFWLYEPDIAGGEDIHLKSDSREAGDTAGLAIVKQYEFTKDNRTYWLYKITVPSTYTAKNGYKEEWEVTDGNKRYEFILYALELGDVDGSGKIDFADALYLKRYLANWDNYSLIDAGAADLNADGKIDDADVMILERHIAGWTGYDTLPKVS